MDDTEILAHIHELVEEEKRLRTEHTGEGLRGEDRGRLQSLEEQLDQAWDLLRRRRAQQEAGAAETETGERSADQVEHYLQ
ncbi:MAG: DUF2630 family protein [bacterium]